MFLCLRTQAYYVCRRPALSKEHNSAADLLQPNLCFADSSTSDVLFKPEETLSFFFRRESAFAGQRLNGGVAESSPHAFRLWKLARHACDLLLIVSPYLAI